MHIGIIGPIATENISSFLEADRQELPSGYTGAPLIGTLIGEMLRRGHTVSAFTTSKDLLPNSDSRIIAKEERLSIHYCSVRPHAFRPKHGQWGRAMDMFATERACLRQAIKDAAPEIVHGHWSYEFGLAAIESGIPHIITCHDAPHKVLRYMPNLYRLMRLFMAKKCLRHANVVTAVSPYLRKEIQRYTHAPVEIVPNPLPYRNDTAFNKTFKNNGILNRPTICMVINGWGRLKNALPALQAFQLLRQEFPEATMFLYGDDFGTNEKAAQWASKHNLDHGVQFIGRLPHAELLAEVAKADILLHPALEETFGMAIAEAMNLGVPVVGGQDSGAVPWVISDGGVTTDVTDPQKIADALTHILGNNHTYLQYAQAAQTHIQSLCDIRTIAQLYEQLYQRTLDSWTPAIT